MKNSKLEILFEQMLIENKIKYQKEFRFHPVRKWRFDFLIDKNIAVEIEGGIWNYGRHNRGSGFIADAEKYNEATILGFKLLRYHNSSLKQFIKHYERIKNENND